MGSELEGESRGACDSKTSLKRHGIKVDLGALRYATTNLCL